MIEHIVNDNKKIHVFDNLLSFEDRETMFNILKRSYFTISSLPNGNENMHAMYDEKASNSLPLAKVIQNSQIKDLIEGMRPTRSVLNLSFPSSHHLVHSHTHKKVVLYYPNLEWKQDWYGETVFYNESITEVSFCCHYTPGRIVVFDGSIPHSIRPQSIAGPQFRMTYGVMYE